MRSRAARATTAGDTNIKTKSSRTKGRDRVTTLRIAPDDHVRGAPLAKITLVGYGDFANPECSNTHRTVDKIREKMGSRLRYVFRCFPDAVKFAGAETLAEAAECAADQGKFWEMHDLLFDVRCPPDEVNLARCAREIGLDVGQFRRGMRDHIHLANIRASRRAGARRGVARSPTFFVNSQLHESSFGVSTLLSAIQAAAGGA